MNSRQFLFLSLSLLLSIWAKADPVFDVETRSGEGTIRIEIPGRLPIGREPLPQCRPLRPEHRRALRQEIAQLEQQFECGQVPQMRRTIARISQQLDRMANSGDRGNCWSARNCGGRLLSSQLVDKATCRLLEGKSWQQKLPVTGACTNL